MKGIILWLLVAITTYVAIVAGQMNEWGVCFGFAVVAFLLLWAAPTPGGEGKKKSKKDSGNALASLMARDSH